LFLNTRRILDILQFKQGETELKKFKGNASSVSMTEVEAQQTKKELPGK
jgi:hypothetical protein